MDADRQSPYERVPFGGPQLVILDTNTIFNDLLYQLRRGRDVGVLIRSAEEGAVRLFATVDVYREVHRRAETQARRGFGGDDLLELFDRQYVPHIRFVDVTGTPIGQRALPVGESDPDDLPTAQLALLLAPCQVYSDDSDLTDAGFGVERSWLQVTHSAERVMEVDRTALMLTALARWGWRKLRARARNEYRQLRPVEVALGGLLGITVLAMLPPSGHAALDRAFTTSGRVLAGGGEVMLGAGVSLLGERVRQTGFLAQTIVAPEAPPTPVGRLARELALRGPLQSSALGAALGLELSTIEGLFRSHACFVHEESGWSLGRQLAPLPRCTEAYPVATSDPWKRDR